MIGDGLSLEQAPPFKAPLRFFLTAPLFLILGALFLFIGEFDLSSRWMPHTIGAVHFFTLGFLTMTMTGALTQMLPVLAGITIPNVAIFSTIIHLLISIGSLLFPFGMIFSHQYLIGIGAISAILGISLFHLIIIFRFKNAIKSDTVSAFFISSLSTLFLLFFATFLAYAFYTGNFSLFRIQTAEIHVAWAIFGMTFNLIMGVTYKVVPMFYVTKNHPLWMSRYGSKIIFSLLIIWTLLFYFEFFHLIVYLKILLAFMVALFSLITIQRFTTRKRPITDTTILYWKLSMALFFVSAILYALSQLIFLNLDERIGMLFGCGFLSLITGMLYKIIPFLTWFHATAKRVPKVPTMRELLSDSKCRLQFCLHATMVIFFIIGQLKIALFLLALNGIWILWLILIPVRYFLRVKI